VHKKGRRSGRGKSGGKLCAYVTAFSDTGNDETAIRLADGLDRLAEGLGKAVSQGILKGGKASPLHRNRPHGGFDGIVFDQFDSARNHGRLLLFQPE
jgi:hypothetical protein